MLRRDLAEARKLLDNRKCHRRQKGPVARQIVFTLQYDAAPPSEGISFVLLVRSSAVHVHVR